MCIAFRNDLQKHLHRLNLNSPKVAFQTQLQLIEQRNYLSARGKNLNENSKFVGQ